MFRELFVGMKGTVRFDAPKPLEVTLKLPSNDGEESRAEVTLPLRKGGIAAQEQQSAEERTVRALAIEEYKALSNCARLDVMLSLRIRTMQQLKGNGSNGVVPWCTTSGRSMCTSSNGLRCYSYRRWRPGPT